MSHRETYGRSDIESIGAVTLVTHDMAGAIGFYTSLGFDLINGGPEASFSSFAIGDGFLNLMARPGGRSTSGWGRLILYVSDVDGLYRKALEFGLTPEAPPRDAEWGERYFHLTRPRRARPQLRQALDAAIIRPESKRILRADRERAAQ